MNNKNNTYKKTNSNNHNYKKKKKKRNLYAYADVILIIVLIIILIFIFKPKNKENKVDQNKEEGQEKINITEPQNTKQQYYFYKEENKERYEKYKQEHKELDEEKIIIYVNIGLDKEFYTDIKDSPNKHTNTVLVNKYNYLGDDYVPNNLTKINKKYAISDDKYMEKEAAIAFEEMAKKAKEDGYNIIAISTYRSYKYQTTLYNNYAKSDGKEKADRYSARAGYSEHQTGLAVDVSDGKKSYTKFKDTKEFNWMQENCYKYGFILRYTEENEFITGYMSEAWHYRYVGKEIATYIHNNPMTFEEYYVRFIDK